MDFLGGGGFTLLVYVNKVVFCTAGFVSGYMQMGPGGDHRIFTASLTRGGLPTGFHPRPP